MTWQSTDDVSLSGNHSGDVADDVSLTWQSEW